MKEESQDVALQIVIQFGGSTGEYYLHSFPNSKFANDYMRKADKASYRCIGPFGLAIPGVRNLSCAAEGVLEWLRRLGLEHEMPAKTLANAIGQLGHDLHLHEEPINPPDLAIRAK